VRLLNNEESLPDVAREISGLRKSGVFNGLASILDRASVQVNPRDIGEADVTTISDPVIDTEIVASAGSPELLALIRQMMAKRATPSLRASTSSEDEDQDDDDDDDDDEEDDDDEDDEEDEDEEDDEDEDDDEDEEDDEDEDDDDEDEDDEDEDEEDDAEVGEEKELDSFFPSESEEDYVIEIPEHSSSDETSFAVPSNVADIVKALIQRKELTDVANVDGRLLQRSLAGRVPKIPKKTSSRIV
jgi:cobalamin biosynthesis protein CobT